MLLFEPLAPYVKWHRMNKGNPEEGKCIPEKKCFDALYESPGDPMNLMNIGYVLDHGGEEIKSPVSRLTEQSIGDVEKCIKHDPEPNDITFKTIKYWMERIPSANHFLLCDTAFFLKLPEEASTYAIPYELKSQGLRRFGGYGLLHRWVSSRIKYASGESSCRLISVCLGNNTNMAAIKNGMPIDTSIGFTGIEGIMSSGGCGDIDPTIIFNLDNEGLELSEINRLLSRESGFKAFLGENAGFLDIIDDVGKGPAAIAREVFGYSILKYIGAFIAKLGGVDSIVFASDNLNAAESFIFEIASTLRFMGIQYKMRDSGEDDFYEISEPESKIKVFCCNYNRWNILNQSITEIH
jgi:acetate kinase